MPSFNLAQSAIFQALDQPVMLDTNWQALEHPTLHKSMFIEPNPTGVKYALSVLGRIGDDVRLPLVTVSEPTRTAIRSAMVHAGLIN